MREGSDLISHWSVWSEGDDDANTVTKIKGDHRLCQVQNYAVAKNAHPKESIRQDPRR